MIIHQQPDIPLVLDNFHHEFFGNGASLKDSINEIGLTWNKIKDGSNIVDYSSQQLGERKGKDANTIDISLFEK